MINKYSYSTDEHQDFYGEFNSPEDAAKAAFYETGCDCAWVGMKQRLSINEFVSADVVIDDIADPVLAYEWGDGASQWLCNLRSDTKLKCELENLIGDWIQKQNPPDLFEIVGVRCFKKSSNGIISEVNYI